MINLREFFEWKEEDRERLARKFEEQFTGPKKIKVPRRPLFAGGEGIWFRAFPWWRKALYVLWVLIGRKGATVKRSNNWWIGGWRDECPRCELEVDDDVSIYCSNCGKFLGEIRETLWVPAMFALVSIAFGSLIGLMWATGAEPRSPYLFHIALITCGTVAVVALLATKPLGAMAVRRERWIEDAKRRNEEAEEKRKAARIEEGRRRREEAAEKKPDISLKINAEDCENALRLMQAKMKKEVVEKRLRPKRLGACNCGEGDKSPIHFVWCEKAKTEKKTKRFPLMSSNDFAQTQIGTIEVDDSKRLRVGINEGVTLHCQTDDNGVLQNFFLKPISRPPIDCFAEPKTVTDLPVRNGPPLTIEYETIPDNVEGEKVIRHELETSQLRASKNADARQALRDVVYRWERFRPGCAKGPRGAEICTNCDQDEAAVCEMINKGRKVLVEDSKRCHKAFLSPACGVVIHERSPMGPNSCDKTLKDCIRWENEARFSL